MYTQVPDTAPHSRHHQLFYKDLNTSAVVVVLPAELAKFNVEVLPTY